MAVDRQRQIPADPFRVSLLLGLRDHPIAVGVDAGKNLARDIDAGGQPKLQRDMVLLHLDRRGLEVLVEPVREGR